MMEFVDGASLRKLIQTRKITPEEALAIVPKICEALQYAHDQGVVHRDIKPENVLLDHRGRVKIADFGIAKIVGRDAKPSLTEDHRVVGTPNERHESQAALVRHCDYMPLSPGASHFVFRSARDRQCPPACARGLATVGGGPADGSHPEVSTSSQLDPKNSAAWNGLGWASFNSGKAQEAERAFRKVIELEPNHAAALKPVCIVIRRLRASGFRAVEA